MEAGQLYQLNPISIRAALSRPNVGNVLYGYHLLLALVKEAFASTPEDAKLQELHTHLSRLDKKGFHYTVTTAYDPNSQLYRSTIEVNKFNTTGEAEAVGRLEATFSLEVTGSTFSLSRVTSVDHSNEG